MIFDIINYKKIYKFFIKSDSLHPIMGWATGLPGRLGKKSGIFPLKSRIKIFFPVDPDQIFFYPTFHILGEKVTFIPFYPESEKKWHIRTGENEIIIIKNAKSE